MSKPPEENAGAAPPAAKGSILGKLMVLMLVVVVVVVECVVAYVCIPTADATASPAGGVKPPVEHKKGEAEPAAEGELAANVEVDMKEYSVTAYKSAARTTLRVDFHLWGVVDAEHEKEAKKLFDENAARFKEQVSMTIRGAEMTDLTETSMGLIKRQLLDKARKTFGKPLLKEIIISDYAFIEQ